MRQSYIDVPYPGVVRLVDRLVERGLLHGDRSATDGRAVALTLTGAGQDSCDRILSSRQSSLSRALATLCPADRNASLR